MATPAAILSILVQAQGIVKTSAQLDKLDQKAERTARSTENLDRKFSSLDRTVGDFNRTMTAARNTVGLVKWPALIAGAGMAAQAIGALSAGVVSLGSALGPLAGAGAAGAAGMTALGQAAGVATLATIGLEDAIKGQKGAMDKLSPVQRNFVKDIRALQGETRALRGDAQRGLLPGLDKALKTVVPLFNQLRPIVKATAEVMGELAVSGARVVRSWGSDLQTVGKNNVTVIKNLGTAAIAAADAARHLVVAGGPLLKWLSEVAVKGAGWVRAQVEAGRESGRLAGFLEKTRDVMTTLGHIAVNLGAALFGIGKAAAPLGRDLLGLFEDLTKKFREWVESATGRNTLDDYFRSAREPILQVAGLIGDVGKAFLELSQPGPEAGGMIEKLRELVPVLQNVIATTTAAFGPVLIDALGNVVRLFGQLAGTSGPLTVFVQLIGVLAGGLADLLSSNPALNSMVVSLLGFAGVIKALGLVSAITGLSALGGVITGAAAAYRALAAGATVATVAQERGAVATLAARAAMVVATAATVAYTAAQWLLNVALTANPIGAVIVGLAALGAAFVVAYTKISAFRNAVDATFAWIKGNWPLVLAILTGPIGTAVLVIAKNWDAIKGVFRSGVAAAIGILRGAVGGMTSAGKALGQGVINGFKAALNIAHEVAQAVRDAISKALNFGLGLGKKLAEGIKQGVKDIAGTSLLDVIKDKVGGGDGIGKTGRAIGKTLAKSQPGTVKAGKGSAALKGANSALGPFAQIGASMGLSVSSGLRRGAITSSGNVSYHSSGEAIDMSNGRNTPEEMKYFRYMKSHYGSQLAELIFTPGGAGIKDGKPFTYTGQVAADHWDHVHVALDLGKPGVGIGGAGGKASDGLGKFVGDGIGGNVKAVWQFLIANGFSQAQAAGIIGVMQGESGQGLSTTALNKSSGAFGIAQWLGGRKSALMQRKNPNSLQTQLNFLLSELHGPEAAAFKKIKGAHSIEEAVNAWLFSFERPGPGEAKVSMRLGNARNVFSSLKGVGGAGGGGGGGGTGGGNKNALEQAIQKNLDRIDALRKKLRHLPSDKKYKPQRTKLQDQISALLAKNRDIRDKIKNLPKGGAPEEKISNYEMIQSLAGTAIAQAATTPDVADDILANTQLRDATTFRIKQVRKALKKPNLTQGTRKRLTDELGTLLGTHTELQGTLKDLRQKPLADALQKQSDLTDAKLQIAQTTDSLADDLGPLGDKVTLLTKIYEAQTKKFGANSVEAQMALANLTSATKDLTTAQHDAMVQGVQYQLKLGDAALVAAKINTPGDTSDDLAALQYQLKVATDAYNNAVNVTGNTDDMIEFGGQVLSLRDAIESLQGTVEQNTQALLDAEKQRNEDLRKFYNTSQTELASLQKAIAAVANRQIGGGVGLGYMTPSFPGGGVRY